MKRVYIFILMVIASSTFGEWSTNAWPSYDWPRQGMVHSRECYSGIVERLYVLGILPDTVLSTNHPYLGNMGTNSWPPSRDGTNFWFRSTIFNSEAQYGQGPRNSLGVLKAVVLSDVLTSYADYSQTNGAGVFGGTNLVDLPVYDETSICEAAGLPTNFFAFTPWRCLNGAGPFTNDATRSIPYGWTNATTAAGGTNFPGSWTNWYTTDYGWQGLYQIINACKWTLLEPESADVVRTFYDPIDGYSSCLNNYDAATNEWATSATHRTNLGSRFEVYLADLTFADGLYSQATRRYGWSGADDVPTNGGFECSIDVYFSHGDGVDDPPGATNNFNDIDSLGVTNGLYVYFETLSEAGTTNRGGIAESSVYPSTDLTDPFLAWPISCPYSGNYLASTNWNGGGNWAVWGGVSSVDLWVLKWDGANGFNFQD